MSPSYEVVLLHKKMDDFAQEVAETIKTTVDQIFAKSDLLDFKYEMSDVSPDSQVAVVYLGSTEGRRDAAVGAALEDAVGRPFPVLPIVRRRDPGTTPEKLPTTIEHINAAVWDIENTTAPLTLLAMLGLVDQERKLFLSYRQTESTPMAVQLHTELVRNRFDVFLDRFALAPGEDFQKRLDEDLGDKAFVVLMESADLQKSAWVQHEIAYAHSHRIDILAITLPGVARSQLVPAIDEAFRIRLSENDFAPDGQLAAETLRVIPERIHLAHAKALRRRREQLLGSLIDQLDQDGCTCAPLGDWAILATGKRKVPEVFFVTPRRPGAKDLYAAHVVRCDAEKRTGRSNLSGAVVHEVEHIPCERQSVLTWIAGVGDLNITRLRQCALRKVTAA